MSSQSQSPSTSEQEPGEVGCDLDTTSTRDIRRTVRDMLAGYSGITVDDAVLVVDELVCNAHRHGETPRSCRLALLDQGRCLRVEVDDTSPQPPRMQEPDRTGGRGLLLVDQLASTWGVRRHAHHKTVWAELALDHAGSSGHARHLATTSDWQDTT